MYDKLKEAFNNKKIHGIGNKRIIENPLTELEPELPYQLLFETASYLSGMINPNKKIVSEEHGCGPIAGAISYLNGNTLALARWTPDGLAGDISSYFPSANYRMGKMVLQGVEQGDDVVIVEDLLDKGDTSDKLIKLIESKGANICDIIFIAEKLYSGQSKGRERLNKKYGYELKTLFGVEVAGDRSEVVRAYLPENIYQPCTHNGNRVLHDSLENQILVRLSQGRNFLLNPLTEQYPSGTSSELLYETVEQLSNIANLEGITKVVTEFDRCAHLCGAFAIKHHLPIGGARWSPGPSSFRSDISTNLEMEYHKGKLFGYGINSDDKVLIIDDAVSSGGTFISMINLCMAIGAEIIDAVAVFAKNEYEGIDRIKKETGVEVKPLLNISVESGLTSKILKDSSQI